MCNRVATPDSETLREKVNQRNIAQFARHYHSHGFDHEMLPVTTIEQPMDVELGMWGLIPGWMKDTQASLKYAHGTLNARSEEIFEKRSYMQYIGKWRCLLWVDGFYEHQWQDKDGKVKHPHFIYMPDRAPFTLGCVYSKWLDVVTNETVTTFSIITTRANDMMAGIHNSWNMSKKGAEKEPRMPYVVMPGERDVWLSQLREDQIKAMMSPLPDGILTAHKVGKLAGNSPASQQLWTDQNNTLF